MGLFMKSVGEGGQSDDSLNDFAISLFMHQSDGVVAFDQDLRILIWNPAMEELSGVPAAEALGKPVLEALPFMEQRGGHSLFQKVLLGEKNQLDAIAYHFPVSNHQGFVRIQTFPAVRAANEIRGGMALVREVTAPVEVQERTTLLQQLTDAIPSMVNVYDLLNKKLLYINGDTLGLGYSPDDLRSEIGDIPSLVHPDDLAGFLTHRESLEKLADGEVANSTYRVRNAAGEWRWIRTHNRVVNRTDEGAAWQVMGISEDVTQQKQTDDLLKGILDTSLNGTMAFKAIRDENGEIVDFEWTMLNAAAARNAHNTPEYFIGKRLLVEQPTNRQGGLFAEYVNVVETGEPLQKEHLYNLPFMHRWLSVSAVKLGDGFVATYVDITQRKEVENLLSGVLNVSLDGITAFQALRDESDNIIDFSFLLLNHTSKRLLNRHSEELLGRRLFMEYPELKSDLFEQYVRVVETGQPMHYELHRQGRDQIWIRIQGVKYEDGLVTTFTNITEQKQAEGKIRRSEMLLRESQAIGHIGSFDWDIARQILMGTPELYEIFGYTYPEEIDVPKFFDRIHSDDQALLREALRRSLHESQEYDIEYRITRPDQAVSFVWAKGKVFYDEQGQPERMLGTILDITRQKTTEFELQHKNQALSNTYEELAAAQEELTEANAVLERRVEERTRELQASEEELRHILEQTVGLGHQIRQSENFLSSIIDQSPISTWIADAHGLMVRINNACLQLMGAQDASQVVGIYNIFKDKYIQKSPYCKDIQAVFTEGRIIRFSGEYDVSKVEHIRVPTGVPLTLITTIFPVKDATGKVTHGVIQHEDITQRRLAEEALRESEQRYRFMADFVPVIVWTAKADGEVDYYNQRWFEYVGYSFEETAGWGWEQCIHPDDLSLTYATWRESLQLGREHKVEHRLKGQDGRYRWFITRAMAFRNEHGNVVKWFGTSTDIDEEKRIEQERKALFQREQTAAEQFRLLLESIPQMAWTALPDGSFNYFNHRWYEYTGQTPEQALHDGWKQSRHPDDLAVTIDKWAHSFATGETFAQENRILRRADQKYRWHLTRGVPIRDEQGQIMLWIGTCTDMHDLILALENLAKVQRQFQFLAEFIPQIVWRTQPNGDHDYFNQRWYEYTGLSFEDSKNRGWALVLHPEDYERTQALWSYSLKTGEPYQIEYRFRRTDGEYRWFLARALALRAEDGTIASWFGTCTDIHDQKLALEEIARVQEQIFQTNDELSKTNLELRKINQDLDNFVYTASHDLKAPIANLEGFLLVLNKRLSGRLEDREKPLMEMMFGSVNKFKQTIQDLTEITKVQKALHEEEEWLSFEEMLTDVKGDIASLLYETGTRLTTDFAVKEIRFARKNMRSILYNLVSNGVKYRSPERSPEIHLVTWLEDQRIRLTVQDNGLGIAAEQLPKLFGMFKRLHTHVEGTGIGLYIVKRIVENHGGSIHAQSELGKGTMFHIYLPVDSAI